ncbi:Sugar-transfer associated ATP-grasp [Gracilibacillus orientalis]|uniref:Sugar-transfer associated ATP-grasp n=2 Tax=Gracilibacillus orientalis TaxID=334253 RepID=A0A1I4PI40_9BACI|nr:Sugar-transfer associated ATP-grasp [Gracilibacillus orientalis]
MNRTVDTSNANKTNLKKYQELGMKIKSKPFKRYYKSGLLDNLDIDYVNSVRDYWKLHYNEEIDPVLNLAFKNLTGNENSRVVPGPVMWKELIPYFNDMDIRAGYSDKNIYDSLIKTERAVKIILKRVRGTYFNSNNESLTKDQALNELLSKKQDYIIKPSRTDNGKGIAKLNYENEMITLKDKKVSMEELEDLYGLDFVVQDVIKQHPVMGDPHPSSVNTLRMVTLRWKNEVRYLLSFARFGANNAVRDNAGTGGVCVGITDDGKFMDYAVDEHTNVYTHHPTTNYAFAEHAQIPNFDKFKEYVIGLHKQILHHDFISWDIAVGEDGLPVFIELNFRGATWLYQLASQRSLFGDLTEEIIEQVRDEKLDKQSKASTTPEITKLKRDHKKLKADNKKKQEEILQLKEENRNLTINNSKIETKLISTENELKKHKKELNKLLNSTSWKLSKPVRLFGKIKK